MGKGQIRLMVVLNGKECGRRLSDCHGDGAEGRGVKVNVEPHKRLLYNGGGS